MQLGTHEIDALIDTGATASLVPKKFVVGEAIVDEWLIVSPLGSRTEPVVKPSVVFVNGVSVIKPKIAAARTRFPIIGTDILFAAERLTLGMAGMRFGSKPDIERAIATVACSAETVRRSGNTAISRVTATLEIDGHEHQVFIDTGRKATLAATAAAPLPSKSSRRSFDIRFNTLGQFRPSRLYRREAVIAVGQREFIISYEHYPKDRSCAEPFILGGGILEMFDLYIAPKDGIMCFFEPGDAFAN